MLNRGMITRRNRSIFPFLTFDNSQDPEEGWKENASEGQNNYQPVDE